MAEVADTRPPLITMLNVLAHRSRPNMVELI